MFQQRRGHRSSEQRHESQLVGRVPVEGFADSPAILAAAQDLLMEPVDSRGIPSSAGAEPLSIGHPASNAPQRPK
jgi:hypothetical protein